MLTFNLISEPWIPCVNVRLQFSFLSIRDLLAHAHEWQEIRDQSPLVTLTLYRFLLALIHRVWQGPKNSNEWRKYFEKGQFDIEPFDEYFAGTDSKGIPLQQRFDLFGDYPFYQDTSIANIKHVPVTTLARELSSTSNKVLFDHHIDDNPHGFSPAECARLILTSQYFAIQDGRGYRPSPLAMGMVVLYRGRNLFEILVNNLSIYSESIPMPKLRKDLPIWETKLPQDNVIPSGYIEYLTWPYRRILLDVNEQSVKSRMISHVFKKNGWIPEIELNEKSIDPLIFYEKNKEVGFVSIKLEQEKSLWRDAHSIFQLIISNKRYRPGLFAIENIVDTIKTFDCFGITNENNKIYIWRHEQLPLRKEYLYKEEFVENLKSSLQKAENLGEKLKKIILKLILPRKTQEKMKKKEKKKFDISKSFIYLSYFWSSLEQPFYVLYEGLPVNSCIAFARWNDTLGNIAKKSLELAIDGLDNSAHSMQIAVRARQSLGRWIKENIHAKEENTDV